MLISVFPCNHCRVEINCFFFFHESNDFEALATKHTKISLSDSSGKLIVKLIFALFFSGALTKCLYSAFSVALHQT